MIPIIIDIGLVKSVTTLTNPMVLQELNSDHYSMMTKILKTKRDHIFELTKNNQEAITSQEKANHLASQFDFK
ncbi:hypothetical protein HZH66_010487 [Vespula vulgaris]|uniref:Uncharacterized protein n=1 Tax=Vespula vulgaris TaxID=7454 RepID=A0A834JJT1_VESVU|nr:hypothetical protein HZH66_010487 [Vespula vulgaris]